MSFRLSPEYKVYIAGHLGLVGSAIVRALHRRKHAKWVGRSRSELDLRIETNVRGFFETEKPDIVFLAAAKVGGIGANSTSPIDFFLDNIRIQNNVISAAAEFNVKKLVFLGSSCVYPSEAKCPISESQLLSGPFEQTNEAYALAKVAGIKLCDFYSKELNKNFISVMPSNLYGPNDYYDFERSHVIPAVFLKVLKAKSEGLAAVKLWGTGNVYREFLHSDDLAEALLTSLEYFDSPAMINIGSEAEIKVKELCELICKICGYTGRIDWDSTKPDGVFRKTMASDMIRSTGWKPRISLEEGLRSVLKEAESKLKSLL